MRMIYRTGECLAEVEITQCLDLLREGGAIQYFKTAKEGLQSALLIATLKEGKELLALGAIKAYRKEYLDKIKERSKFPLRPESRELGYIVVRADHRGEGLSKVIVRQLYQAFPYFSLFATTSSPVMSRTFDSQGFLPRGNSWVSKEGNTLTLWVKY